MPTRKRRRSARLKDVRRRRRQGTNNSLSSSENNTTAEQEQTQEQAQENEADTSNQASDGCIQNNNSNSEFCAVDAIPFVTYEQRKLQSPGSNGVYMMDDGMDYDGSSPYITDLFDESRLSNKIHTASGIENVRRSYIYIISKKVDNRTFIKIGISRLSNSAGTSTRLGFLQTALIPGLINVGFKLHYLLFYSRESKEKGSSFAENIEKDLHKTLQFHRKYKQSVLLFPSNNPSEWYLPRASEYEDFMKYVLNFIRAQIPFPEEGYHFYERYGKIKRDPLERFMKRPTDDDNIVQEFRRNYVKLKSAIIAKHKFTRSENDLKKGSKLYFTKKLIKSFKEDNPPLGDTMMIKEIYYHNKKSDELRTHKEYYASIINTDEPNERPDIHVDFNETRQDNTIKYYTSMRNVLEKMKELDTLEAYGLQTNYNYYVSEPVIQMKKKLENLSSESQLQFKVGDVKWILGRYVRDNHDEIYRAEKLIHNPYKKSRVKNVEFVKIDPTSTTLDPITPIQKVKANIVVALQLIVDYHEGVVSQYSINSNVDDEEVVSNDSKYNIYDFIEFKSGYFKDTDNRPIRNKFMGFIVQKYHKFDDEKQEVLMFYDILFEDELWRLDVKDVDDNSSKVNSKTKQKSFIDKCNYKKNLLHKVMRELGMEIKKPEKRRGPRRIRKPSRSAPPPLPRHSYGTRYRQSIMNSNVPNTNQNSEDEIPLERPRTPIRTPRRSTRKRIQRLSLNSISEQNEDDSNENGANLPTPGIQRNVRRSLRFRRTST
jgi:hypothetical protein